MTGPLRGTNPSRTHEPTWPTNAQSSRLNPETPFLEWMDTLPHSAGGIVGATSASLIADLPELGRLNRRRVAPNPDSATFPLALLGGSDGLAILHEGSGVGRALFRERIDVAEPAGASLRMSGKAVLLADDVV